jgi:hypothetical protein
MLHLDASMLAIAQMMGGMGSMMPLMIVLVGALIAVLIAVAVYLMRRRR